MHPEEFPPNSDESKKASPRGEPKVDPVVTGGAKRRRKSLRRQFKETFVAGDAKSAGTWVIFEVLLPGAREVVAESITQGVERIIFGSSKRRSGSLYPPQTGPAGNIMYNQLSQSALGSRFLPRTPGGLPGPERVMSRQARAAHNFDEIVLTLRSDAEQTIDQLMNIVARYGQASVANLYELVSFEASHVDHKWGWTDLTGAGVTKVRDGYLLDLPSPHPL
jgi:hypothetical protein